MWGREFTSKSVAEQYCRLDCPLDVLVIDLKRVELAQLPDFSLVMSCYLSEVQSKGLLGFRFCQMSKRGRERHGTPLVVQGLRLLPTKGAQGWSLVKELRSYVQGAVKKKSLRMKPSEFIHTIKINSHSEAEIQSMLGLFWTNVHCSINFFK